MKKEFLSFLLLISCLTTFLQAQQPARAGMQAQDYERLGLNPTKIEQWEDGLRTSGKPQTYEWWYFDIILKDSSKLVIVYYTKPLSEVPLVGFKPMITVQHTDKNGNSLFNHSYHATSKDYSFAKDKCNVRIENSYCRGDLTNYEIHLNTPKVKADIYLTSEIPSWRAATGYLFFGKKEQQYFAWLPAVPKGKTTGSISYNNQSFNVEGSGYHDHNWGNRVLSDLLDHWYWTRTEMGDYTVIASQIYAKKKYGNQVFPIFYVAKGDKMVAQNGFKTKFDPQVEEIDSVNQKQIFKDLTFDYNLDNEQYKLQLKQQRYIAKVAFVNSAKPWQRFIMKTIHFNPTYYRMEGDVSLDVNTANHQQTLKGNGIWELFYFGNWKKQK